MTAGASKTAADHPPPRRPSIKRCFALRAPPVGLRAPYAARSARARVGSTLRHRERGSLLRADRGAVCTPIDRSVAPNVLTMDNYGIVLAFFATASIGRAAMPFKAVGPRRSGCVRPHRRRPHTGRSVGPRRTGQGQGRRVRVRSGSDTRARSRGGCLTRPPPVYGCRLGR